MSGLSSRVKSMKFMQQVRPAGSEDIEESPQKKVSLSSEWTLPHAAEVLKRSRQKPQVDTIGYGSISAFDTSDETAVPQGRKVWGKPEESIRQIDIGRIKDSIIDEKAGKAGKAGQDAEENAEDDDSGDDSGDNSKNGAHSKSKKQKGKRKASSGRKSNKKQKK
ncbi:predicted protein [Meyerozyma guilliermondii ATCC 6260]|uniref:M-phase phosphoprotein 6 n=1 Tax=Meyerozyma guilliermondii (strain ATCC 6260 / CBS 566 / DSM 6381 / JCM 1539 / NBRC 10279 / NRRL Y-324) TaxID=294746 RepID=A5DBZ6_PICGU|nr:uncharacterized protein PGUG_00801 [Meyerozyma guilliermondii ATCC 6260]EDK36703.2 predicted protein [Meyerozyma guilliermondii ATCC 6260]